MVLVCSVKI